MQAAMVSALMPVFEKLLDKIFDLFQNSSDSYNSSAKTDDDLDKFVEEAKQNMGEFETLATKVDPNFTMSGDADSSSDFREIVNVLEQIKAQTTDTSELKSIDSMIEAFTDAANQMDAPSYTGDKGDADLTITSPGLVPTSGATLVAGYPTAPASPTNAVTI
jgi:hypothetical protein